METVMECDISGGIVVHVLILCYSEIWARIKSRGVFKQVRGTTCN